MSTVFITIVLVYNEADSFYLLLVSVHEFIASKRLILIIIIMGNL